MRILLIAALAVFLVSAAQAAEDRIEIIGKALALDGDTINVTTDDGETIRVRLYGVDAPEMKVWPWGPKARRVLDNMIRGERVRCTTVEGKKTHDRYKRLIALCTTATTVANDTGMKPVSGINGAMIVSGFAVEARQFTGGRFLAEEFLADGKGVWAD